MARHISAVEKEIQHIATHNSESILYIRLERNLKIMMVIYHNHIYSHCHYIQYLSTNYDDHCQHNTD